MIFIILVSVFIDLRIRVGFAEVIINLDTQNMQSYNDFTTNISETDNKNDSSIKYRQSEVTPGSVVWDRRIKLNDNWDMTIIPAEDLYPIYIADPRRSSVSIMGMYFSNSEINSSGDNRIGLRLGGQFGMFRFHRREDQNHGFQLDVEVGFMGQFDIESNLDNIGWDGIYGFQLSWAPNDKLAFKIGLQHDSSHVGDEYAESHGRKRIEYTREEFLIGVSRFIARKWRLYAEGAYAYLLLNQELMKPWRVQCGLEYVSPDSFLHGSLGWYTAADISSFEENDWDANITAQIGLIFPVKGLEQNYRLAFEYYNGIVTVNGQKTSILNFHI